MDEMTRSPRAVTQGVTVEVADPVEPARPVALDAELAYDPTCPYAVTVTFAGETSAVTWTFGRDLLLHGIYEPAGDGDVRVRPALDAFGQSVLLIELHSPTGQAHVQAPAREVHRFVEAMAEVVPPGTESQHLDLDATIAAVLVASDD